jgi:hypothetical protein
MKEKELTSVEWLVKQLNINGTVIPMEIESKAKRIFDKQIRDAWNDGLWGKLREGEDNAESYLNETFKQQEQ